VLDDLGRGLDAVPGLGVLQPVATQDETVGADRVRVDGSLDPRPAEESRT
jgi:hypothetical protein